MAYYKIKNITGKLPKRHVHKDMKLKIEYQVGFQKKFHELTAGNEVVLSCRTLPASVHALRAKQLVNVIEISENDFMKLQKPSAKKATANIEKVVEPKKEEKKRSTRGRKKTTTTKAPVEE